MTKNSKIFSVLSVVSLVCSILFFIIPMSFFIGKSMVLLNVLDEMLKYMYLFRFVSVSFSATFIIFLVLAICCKKSKLKNKKIIVLLIPLLLIMFVCAIVVPICSYNIDEYSSIGSYSSICKPDEKCSIYFPMNDKLKAIDNNGHTHYTYKKETVFDTKLVMIQNSAFVFDINTGLGRTPLFDVEYFFTDDSILQNQYNIQNAAYINKLSCSELKEKDGIEYYATYDDTYGITTLCLLIRNKNECYLARAQEFEYVDATETEIIDTMLGLYQNITQGDGSSEFNEN